MYDPREYGVPTPPSPTAITVPAAYSFVRRHVAGGHDGDADTRFLS